MYKQDEKQTFLVSGWLSQDMAYDHILIPDKTRDLNSRRIGNSDPQCGSSVKFTFGEEERLQIVPQRDSNDWEICGQSKHWEQTEEVVYHSQVPHLTLHRGKVQGVQVVELTEGEDPGERQQDVEH